MSADSSRGSLNSNVTLGFGPTESGACLERNDRSRREIAVFSN
jgi:hypothetical protein